MKNSMKKYISMITGIFLLAACLLGCGSTSVAEATQSNSVSQQETPQEQPQKPQENEQMPEMEAMEIPEEDIEKLLQAGQDAVADENDLWSIYASTDMESLMQLVRSGSGMERPEGENGEEPKDITPPDGETSERLEGEMPDGTMPNRDGENPPEDMEGTFSEGEMPEDGQGRGEGGGKQRGTRGGEMVALAIVISGTEDTTLAPEDIFAQIQLAAEELGYLVNSTELTEEQQAVIEVPDGHSVKMVVLINAQMPEMDAGEAVG